MHWFWRGILAFLVSLLVLLAVQLAGQLTLTSQWDRELLTAAWGLVGGPLFFVFYRFLPGMLLNVAAPPADDRPAPAGRWLAGPWWKWCLLIAACSLDSLCKAGVQISRWNTENLILSTQGLPPPGGLPARLSPATRDLLANWFFKGWPALVASALGWTALYLFWRDWRTPKLPAGMCSKCGYNLTGNISGTCPECGSPVPEHDSAKAG